MFSSVAAVFPGYFTPIVFVPWGVAFFQLTLCHHRMDKFLARLFAEHRDVWDALGRPGGWQWSPPRGSRSSPCPQSIDFDWLRREEPAWLSRIPNLADDYRIIRKGYRRWTFMWMPVMASAGLLFALLTHIFSAELMSDGSPLTKDLKANPLAESRAR